MPAPPVDAAPPVPTGPATRRGFTTARVLGVAAMLAMVLFWTWIFSGAPRRLNPDRLDDRAWVERAEASCAEAKAAIDARLPDGDPAHRADQIDQSTAELRALLDRLRSPLPVATADVEVVEPWLADWETLLADRDRYAAALRVDPDAQFLTTEKFSDPIGRVIEVFADVNDMPSCGPPGDVA